jgi:hypothetical protein
MLNDNRGSSLKKGHQSKEKSPKQPESSRKFFSKTLVLEVLFFVALGVFGFAVVTTVLGRGERTQVISFVPGISGGEVEQTAPMLYEAPSGRDLPAPHLSPIFMPSVKHWERDILRWSEEYGVDPNLIATVMQIESCGGPDAQSYVGATGLFQVMPFHFETSEDAFDPDTNAKRGIAFLSQGLQVSGGHAGLALAGYNGGHSVISRGYETWPTETQRYYRWGSGIYREASAGWDTSPTLNAWLEAGGQSLCDQAELELDLADASP